MRMRNMVLGIMATAAAAAALPQPVMAQEQFFGVLVYRTGAYAPNGIPWANGYVDYLNLINERDGGINGVKITFEECETGYATDRGVECYERLKARDPVTKGTVYNPLSTGITFALIERAPVDKVPLITMGYGRTEAVAGQYFPWTFPLLGTYWTAADTLIQHIGTNLGGADKLKGKKIALVYHDSPYGKEPIPVLQAHAQRLGFQLDLLPVTHPGVEQKSTWLQVRQSRPDFVLLWGWGVMNSTAIKEAAAVNYPREKMYGVWWSGAEQDVRPAEGGATGYNALALHPSGNQFGVTQDILKHVYGNRKGAGKAEEVGEVLYNRGMINAMLSVEAVRTAMGKFGNGTMSGEQVRWGIENLNLTEERLKEMGFDGLLTPMQVTCNDHEGSRQVRVQQWDGQKWNFVSDWIQADREMLWPMIQDAAAKYAAEKGLQPAACQQ